MAFSKRYNVSFPAGALLGDIWITIKEELTNSGLWTVIGSGSSNAGTFEFQGSTAGAGGGTSAWDVWVTPADVSALDSWCLFEDANGRQLLVMGPQVAGFTAQARILWDFEGNYTATGISATVPPAATAKEQPIVGTRTTASAFSSNFTRLVHIFVEDEQVNGTCPFHILMHTNTGTRHYCFGLFACDGAPAVDGEPYFWVDSSTFNIKTWEGVGTAGERWLTGGILASSVMTRAPYFEQASGATTNYLHSLFPTAITSSGAFRHPRGIMPAVLGITSPDSSFNSPNYSQPDANGITWIYFGNFAVWWSDEPSPVVVAGGTPTQVNSEFFLYGVAAGAADVTPPVISITTPAGPLASRTAPLVFDVSDDTALGLVTVLVNFPTLGITECAYHNGSFRAPYTGSTFSAPTFTLTRTGGWPADPTLDVSAVDAAGNIQS